jgi:nifR3 family TIM-barrel protein
MAALTDTVFRRMIKRQGGCGFVVTEMVASEALVRGCAKAKELLRYAEEERPIGGQIMGAHPARMAEAARAIEAMGFDFVDVNMGCPAKKIVSGGGGSALMRDLRLAESILGAIRAAVSIPLTIKIRAGWNDECLNAPEVAKAGEASGAVLVSVHARTKADAYRPGIREDLLVETKRAVAIPVVANGDIRDAAGARALLARTGCDGVMSGRGAVANPWLLREIATGDRSVPTPERSRRWILDHFSILCEELEPQRTMSKLKTFSGWYTRGLMGGARLRERIQKLRTPQEFLAEVEEYFARYPAVDAFAGSGFAAAQDGRP